MEFPNVKALFFKKSCTLDPHSTSTPTIKKKRGRPRKIQIDAITESRSVGEETDEIMQRTLPPPPMARGEQDRPPSPAENIDQHEPDQNLPELDRLSLFNNVQPRTRTFGDLSRVLPTFDPITEDLNIHQWIDKIEEYADMYGWDDLAIKHYGLSKLDGVARKWKDSLGRADRSWDEWKVLLKETFPTKESGIKKVLEAQNYKRKAGQNIVEYFYEKLSKCNNARMESREIIEWIVDGLDNPQYRSYLGPLSRYNHPTDLLPDLKSGSNFIREYTRPVSKPTFPKRQGHHFSYQQKENMGKFDRTLRSENSRETQVNKFKDTKPIVCFKCGNEGHYARNCSENTKKKEHPKSTENSENREILHINGNTHAKYFKQATINKMLIRCHVDLGSRVTTLRKDRADDLNLTYFENKSEPLTGYGGGQVTPFGIMTVEIEIDGVAAKCDVFVVPNEAQVVPLLVGHSYTEQDDVHILNTQGSLSIANDLEQLLKIEAAKANKTKFVVTEEIVILKNYLGHVSVVGNISNDSFYIEGSTRENGNIIPRCVINTDKNGESVIPIMNLSSNEMKVKQGQMIARGEVCEEKELTQRKNIRELNENEIDSDLEKIQHTQLVQLMNQYREIVATNNHEMGRTNSAEIEINLTSDKPICYRPYRLSYHEKEQVKDLIKDLKEADVIEDSTSQYASPILLVRKKTGEVKMCVDYRALNKITIKDKYPIPLIDDQIDKLRGHRYFTSLDLFSGYYQVPVAENSREKTAFITPDGHY